MSDRENETGASSENAVDLDQQASFNINGPAKKQSLRKWLWIGAGGGVIVLGAIAYGSYTWYQNHQFQRYADLADAAASVQNYGVAIADYQQALSYKSDIRVQARLAETKDLRSSHTSYLKAQQEAAKGDWQAVFTDVQKVSPTDKQDYAAAQALKKKSQTIVLVGRLMKDLDQWNADVQTLEGDLGAAAGTSNDMPNNLYNRDQLSTDAITLNSEYSSLNDDLQKITDDGAQINTDGQLVPDPQVKDALTSLEYAISTYENDIKDILTVVDGTENNANNDVNELTNGGFPTYSVNYGVDQWNTDFRDLSNQDTTISNSTAKLRAYVQSQQANLS